MEIIAILCGRNYNKKVEHTFEFKKVRIILMAEQKYLCIDLKSFFASVECVERGLDALTTNLVVADPDRTEKTVCLAVSPSLRAMGIRNRCRVFEIPDSVPYIMAPPRMQLYIDYSADIYAVYLKYIAKEDIHVYSIDEAFLDVTNYLSMYRMDAKTLGGCIMDDIYRTTQITAACGIGSNLYLAKIALDITAKHTPDCIGVLTEESYRQTLWDHQPITDFWRVGNKTALRLAKYGIKTMRDVTQANEDLLYRLFGVDAELLIDHAWGRESVTIADIKNFKPKRSGISNGQILSRGYAYGEARLVVKEMAESLCLELVEKGLVTDSVSLSVGYDGRLRPEPLKGSMHTPVLTNSAKLISRTAGELYDRIADPNLSVRRIGLSFNGLVEEGYLQYDWFTDHEALKREHQAQEAIIRIKKKYGKNAILKGMDLMNGATAKERNMQIGGHKSGEKT